MPSTNSVIQFKYGLQASYDNILTKDANTIYFTTDSQRLFVGDIEYSRPVSHGTEMPATFLPPNSLFVKEDGDARELFYSKDGESWESICYLPAEITGGSFGNNTAGAVNAGDTINIPSFTVDSHGFVTAAADVAITLPSETPVTIESTGTGNAVTAVEVGEDGRTITVTKDATYMPTAGGDFTGAVTVQAPTAENNPATKKYVDQAIGGLTKMEYQVVTELPATGVKGTIYLIADEHGENDVYDEYLWVDDKFEKIGNTDIDLSDYATTQYVDDELANKVDNTVTVNGQTLTGDVTITDITGNAGSATKLETSRSIGVSGGLTGEAVTFDGTQDVTLNVTAVDGGVVTGTVAAATKATQDEAGNVIAETYATKSEVEAAALTWGAF